MDILRDQTEEIALYIYGRSWNEVYEKEAQLIINTSKLVSGGF